MSSWVTDLLGSALLALADHLAIWAAFLIVVGWMFVDTDKGR